MDYRTKKVISDITRAVINTFSIEIPINDIENVVEILGGRLVEDADLSEYSDGFIRRVENDDVEFEIILSPFQTPARKNFTIAHELGHLFLHMGYRIDKNLWESQNGATFYRNGSSEQEYQANEFAASFLMPEFEYKMVMDRFTFGTMVDTDQIAEYFNVSSEAAANRGKWLGYLQW